jgi:O-antigen/teichoic acid export membrane protein
MRTVLVTYVGIVAVACALAPVAVPLALTDKYSQSSWIFIALAWYALLLGVAPLVTMSANYLGGARERVKLSGVTIATNVVLDLVLVPSMGVWGAAIATSVAFTWYVGAHGLLSMRLLGSAPSESARTRSADVALGLRSIASAAAAGGATWALLGALDSVNDAVAVIVAGAAGLTIFGVAMLPAVRKLDHSTAIAPALEEAGDMRGAA